MILGSGNRGKEEIGVNKRIIIMAAVIALLAVSSFAQAPRPYEPLSGANQTGVRWGLVSAAKHKVRVDVPSPT